MKRTNSKGFTIIELLIATVIFSVILLVITGAIVQFGRIYYKGVVQSRTQERTRAITDSVVRNIQFSEEGSPTQVGSCYRIGNQSYNFSQNSLKLTEGDCGTPGGVEMLGDGMQIVTFDIQTGTNGSQTVHIRVVYGESTDFVDDDPTKPCKPIILGGQFCAVSELTTTVVSRL
jgi:prepilin-type N-terminal cleavage/methylation domain-containing protein